MLSLSAPFIPSVFKEPLDQVMPYADVVIGNEAEAQSYADSHGLDMNSIPEIAKAIAKLPKKNSQRARRVIITQGTDNTVVGMGDEESPKTYPVHAIRESEICDTNGAG